MFCFKSSRPIRIYPAPLTGKQKEKVEKVEIRKKIYSEIIKADLEMGIAVNMSKEYLATNGIFKNEDILFASTNRTITSLPKEVVDRVQDYGTRLFFVSKEEGAGLGIDVDMRNATGCFVRENRSSYVFPLQNHQIDYTINAAGFLECHSERELNSLRTVEGAGLWEATVIHEMSHAACNYNRLELLREYRAYLKNSGEESAKRWNVISRNARTTNEEDFCETFEFYARHIDLVNKAVEREEPWITQGLKARFAFMSEKVWS